MAAEATASQSKVPTIAGVALILSILCFVVLAYKVFLPQQQLNDELFTQLTEMENRLAQNEADLAKLNTQLNRVDYGREIAAIEQSLASLNSLDQKSLPESALSSLSTARLSLTGLAAALNNAAAGPAKSEAAQAPQATEEPAAAPAAGGAEAAEATETSAAHH
ncbi:MAG: hypothetical protein HYV63_20195 [Candidatus Schekmanbacteria bacterium]|nr:hypothetical protein [Candidatus Schekmanbacteria bacterium]